MRHLIVTIVCALALHTALIAQDAVTLRVAGWNVEGNGDDIDPGLIERQLGEKQGVDIWGLSEVRPELFDEFLRGAAIGEGTTFDIVEGNAGNNIRLAIIYDTSVVTLLDDEELDTDVFSRHRAPLIAKFRGKRTNQEFLFMVNHLASGSASANREQAQALNTWAREQTLPVIAVGDYNFRLSLDDGTVRPGYNIMRNGPWFEVEPLFRARTQANFNSILDHVFIANRDRVIGWSGVARIINRNGDVPSTTTDFRDTADESDHRPVDAIFTLQRDVPSPDTADDKLDAVLREMRELARQVKRLQKRIDAMQNE